MGWETRSGRQYYYEKRWQAGTCRSHYVGSGELASLVDKLNTLDWQRRKLDRDIEESYRLEVSEVEKPVNEFCAAVNQIVQAVLLATGHHKPKRVWRKKRVSKQLELQAVNEAVNRLLKDKPKKGDLELAASFLREHPEANDIYGGAIEDSTILSTIQKMGGDSSPGKLAALGIAARLRTMKDEHGYSHASPIEKMLIDQICLCWLRLWWLENIFTQYLGKNNPGSTVLYYEKRLTLCQRRFTCAIETLTKIRRLARRTPEILQVNIAENQVNQVTG